jgi:F-type H+-transporting ATPase subunit c
MSRKLFFILAVLGTLLTAGAVWAAEAAPAAAPAAKGDLSFFVYTVIAAGFGMAIAAFGCGLGQGMAVKGAVEGTARNPEAGGKITVTMLIGLAMIESLAIYALVVALILLYAYPMAPRIATFVGLPS